MLHCVFFRGRSCSWSERHCIGHGELWRLHQGLNETNGSLPVHQQSSQIMLCRPGSTQSPASVASHTMMSKVATAEHAAGEWSLCKPSRSVRHLHSTTACGDRAATMFHYPTIADLHRYAQLDAWLYACHQPRHQSAFKSLLLTGDDGAWTCRVFRCYKLGGDASPPCHILDHVLGDDQKQQCDRQNGNASPPSDSRPCFWRQQTAGM